jgi:hypothetical protein
VQVLAAMQQTQAIRKPQRLELNAQMLPRWQQRQR